MTVGVVTIAHGRHDHLALQCAGLDRSSVLPDVHVVVAMDDPGLGAQLPKARFERHVAHVPRRSGKLPLASARNAGAREAVARGAQSLVFLDVDCVPSRDLVGAYAAAGRATATADDVLCGPVTYLPPPPPEGYRLDDLDQVDDPHPARPAPPPGSIRRTRHRDGYDLFWSLSFALSASTWHRLAGFDERYVGYGGEDTDFARRVEAAGVALAWIGSARAHHQHHPVSSPPVEHVDDIVRNAALFHASWGWWPMRGWLDAFEELGLVERTPGGGYAVREPLPPAPRRTRNPVTSLEDA